MLFSAVLKIFGSLPIGSITASKKAINYYDKIIKSRALTSNLEIFIYKYFIKRNMKWGLVIFLRVQEKH
jgi:hypothetical protein